MTKTCPDCKATVLSTSQPERMDITDSMIEAAARVHNPFAFDGDTSLHRAQSRDEARKEVHAILSAALAAAPAVGREREALINAIDSPTVEALARVFYTSPQRMDKSFSEQIVEILSQRLAAQPASPLRGREILLALAKRHAEAIGELGEAQADKRSIDALSRNWLGGQVNGLAIALEVARVVVSASPPEQPAAYPSAEADEEHADLLRRLATVPDKEK